VFIATFKMFLYRRIQRDRPVCRSGAFLRAIACGGVLLLSSPAARAAHQDQGILRPPVTGCISSPFGWRRALGPGAPAGLHNGVDLAAPTGALVRAAAAGTIVAIRRRGPGGFSVAVRHADGRTTLYAHLGVLVPKVAMGKRDVAAGEPIGHIGRSGITFGPHVFFAVFDRGRAVDPEPLLAVPRCGSPG
jgi:murein DD-endopeptidase MepM/ murein hydrolase activator NlpD